MAKTRSCDDCKHFCENIDDPNSPTFVASWIDEDPCSLKLKPRFYMPRNNDPYDACWGYKRKCSSFVSVEEEDV